MNNVLLYGAIISSKIVQNESGKIQ